MRQGARQHRLGRGWRGAARIGAWAIGGAALLGAGPAAAQECANPACAAALSPACLARIGAGALPAGDGCAAEQDAYVACLRAVAERCGDAAAPQGGETLCAPEDARAEWARLQTSSDVAQLRAFAEVCSTTLQGRLAAARVESLTTAKPAAAPSASGGGGGLFGRQPSPPGPDVAVRPEGSGADSALTGARDCLLPENAAIARGAWRLQTRTGGFGQRSLLVAGRPSEASDNFVGLEYTATSNGWFRYRTADGTTRTMFRGGDAREQDSLTKALRSKPAAAEACAHYRWGAFDIDLDDAEIRIRYDSDGFQYENETLEIDLKDGRSFGFSGRRIPLD